jgi:membrane protease YdiL (CAAX protease family)
VGVGPFLLLYAWALGAGALDGSGDEPEVDLLMAIAAAVLGLVQYGYQTFAAWLFSLRVSKGGLAEWGFVRPTIAFFWTIPLALVATYAVALVHENIVNPPEQDIVNQFPRTAAGTALFVLVAVVMAPLFEELFFRGFLFKGLARSWGWLPAAFVSAAVFGVAHLQLTVFIPIVALGVALAWVYQRTGSLWTSIVLHAIFNGLSVIAWATGG